MTALDVASILKISTVIVPPYPGITSALGLLETTGSQVRFCQDHIFRSPRRTPSVIWPPICALSPPTGTSNWPWMALPKSKDISSTP